MNVLNQVLSDFQSAALNYQPLLVLWALRILTATTFLGGALLMVEAAKRREFAGMLDALFMGLLRIGICYVVLTNSLAWGQGIIDLGQQAGQQITGLSTLTLTPSGIVDAGGSTVQSLYDASTWMLWLHPIDNGSFRILLLVIRFVWFCAAIVYLFVLLQAAWAVAVGPIMLSFAALQYTWSCLFLWIEGLLTIAIKLMATLLTMVVGMREANTWAAAFHALGPRGISLNPIDNATLALLEAGAFTVLVWLLPYVAHRMVRVHMGSGMTWEDAGARSLIGLGKNAALTVGRAAAAGAQLGVQQGLKALKA